MVGESVSRFRTTLTLKPCCTTVLGAALTLSTPRLHHSLPKSDAGPVPHWGNRKALSVVRRGSRASRGQKQSTQVPWMTDRDTSDHPDGMRLFPRVQSSVKPLYQHQDNDEGNNVPSRTRETSTNSARTQTQTKIEGTSISQSRHEHAQHSTKGRNFSFKYRIGIIKIPSNCPNMYEPVSDSCVTVAVGSRLSPTAHRHQHDRENPRQQHHHQQEQSDADDESATTPINNNNNANLATGSCSAAQLESQLQQQQQQQQSQLNHQQQQQLQQPKSPRRLPRRKKGRAPSVTKQDSLDLNYSQVYKNHKSVASMRTGNGDKCIDIDHITLERNYKNKKLNVATQTGHVVPYRLKFWPKLTGDAKCGDDAKASEYMMCCCRTLSQWCLSQIGLALILFCWALLGAFAFYQTEGPREQEQSKELLRLQNELTIELSTNLRQASTHEESWPKMIQKYLTRHETFLLEAVSAGYGEGGGGSIWTYPGCILFAVSLLTTLGFGAPVPRTPLGRGAAILFSAVGIPLHFLLILNIGNMTAGMLHGLATRETTTEIPNINNNTTKTARWLKWLPLFAILIYYILGVILFGFARCRGIVDSLMFPLDFTATGGVAKTSGHVRIFYALYLEVAVTLAAIIVSLVQVTASRGLIDLGLRLGLLTNT